MHYTKGAPLSDPELIPFDMPEEEFLQSILVAHICPICREELIVDIQEQIGPVDLLQAHCTGCEAVFTVEAELHSTEAENM